MDIRKLRHKVILFTVPSDIDSSVRSFDITEGTVLDFSPNEKYVQMQIVRDIMSDTIVKWYNRDTITVLDVLSNR